ncbi:GyrI-like domain-containing protein [Bacteroidales bacterium]|nr:GyrI-like domain-containing protein [Bacteroidales bacterium]
MEIKQIDPLKVASIKVRTTLQKIVEHVGSTPDTLMQEVSSQNIQPQGPQVWVYEGCDGQPDSEFDLYISVPIDKFGEASNGIEFSELRSYKCATTIHNGAWNKLGSSYEKLMKEVEASGNTITGGGREVYLHCDFEDPTKCVTEIQMELN